MSFYAESDFAPDVSIGYLVRRAHQLGGAALEPVFAAEGLTGIQWSALVIQQALKTHLAQKTKFL